MNTNSGIDKHTAKDIWQKLFLTADKVYNFDDLRDWYILLCGSQVIGGTSPASLAFSASMSAWRMNCSSASLARLSLFSVIIPIFA